MKNHLNSMTMRYLLTLLCIATFAFNSWSETRNINHYDHWFRTHDKKYAVSFLMPSKPEKLTRFTGKIPSVVYQTKNNTAVFGIVCSDFHQGGINVAGEDATRLYQQLKEGSLSVPTALLKNEETIDFDNILVKEIEYITISKSREMTYFKRFFIREGKVYQITIGGRSRHREQLIELKNTFFNSLSFCTESPSADR